MLLANFNRKEQLRHRAVSLRQHGFLVYIYCDIVYSKYTKKEKSVKKKRKTINY